MSDKPALLGGSPIFPSVLSVFRPTLPPYESVRDQIAELFQTGMLTTGRFLREFEQRLADALGVKHAVAVSSCTTGLMLACRALDLAGEAIVPSFTFMATVHPLAWNGVTPVFVDIDKDTWNIDPGQIEQAITPRTTAIVAVHLLGTPADVETLQRIAAKHRLRLIFDAAHGFGALRRGKPLGASGDAEVFSATPTKVLVAAEGGVVTTNNDETAGRVRIGRNYGNPGDYGSDFPGLNARMPEFNAILGLRSLEMLEENVGRRNAVAAVYRRRLGALPGVIFQQTDPSDRSSCKEFSLLIEEEAFGLSRDELAHSLKAERIDSRFYYDPPVHTHRSYRHLEKRSLPVTEAIARKTITIPIYSHMDDATVDGVCCAVERSHHYGSSIRAALGKPLPISS